MFPHDLSVLFAWATCIICGMYFDSHAHFKTLDGWNGTTSVVERAVSAGVTDILAVGGNRDLNHHAIEAARLFPDAVRVAIGHDRDEAVRLCAAEGGVPAAMDRLERDIVGFRDAGLSVVALGEMGLDFHYSADTAESQVELFDAELSLSRRMEMPVIIHSREATDETLESLSSHARHWKGPSDCIGVLHCFTGDVPFARRLVDLGFHISFSGIVTFNKAASLREVVPVVPDDRLLIETDSPYLAPVPHRGKRNEPAYVVDVAAQLGDLRGCSGEEIGELTAANAKRLFPAKRDSVAA